MQDVIGHHKHQSTHWHGTYTGQDNRKYFRDQGSSLPFVHWPLLLLLVLTHLAGRVHNNGHAAGEGEMEKVRGDRDKVGSVEDVGIRVVPCPVDEAHSCYVVRHVHQEAKETHGNVLLDLALQL